MNDKIEKLDFTNASGIMGKHIPGAAIGMIVLDVIAINLKVNEIIDRLNSNDHAGRCDVVCNRKGRLKL